MNFLRSLNPYRLSSGSRDMISAQREVILQIMFYILLVLGAGLLVVLFPLSQNPQFIGIFTLIFISYLGLAMVTFMRTIPYNMRAGSLLLLACAATLFRLSTNGVSGPALLLMLLTVILANILFDSWVGGGMLLLAVGVFIYTANQTLSGQIDTSMYAEWVNPNNPNVWFNAGITFLLSGVISAMSFMVNTNGIRRTVERQRVLSEQIEAEQASLEKRVQERAADLRRRLDQFEVASEIAREISQETNIQSLLEKTVQLINQRFNYYHAGIFLNDNRDEYTVLRAATGKAGQQMIERNHRLKIGEIGIVGNVVSKGEARIAMDVNDDIVHYKNPLLPDTRSEMALPLRYAGKAIGALDVQSVDENAFTTEDIKILQTVADQLAIALAKTQQVEELKRSVEELEASHAQMTSLAWQGHLKTANRKFNYRYHDAQLDHSTEETDHSKQALGTGQPVIAALPDETNQRQNTALAVPIKLRNQVLGVLDIHFDGPSVSPDLIALIEGTVDRLAISLENARLLEEIQYRAERERLVSEISTRVRTASDVDTILQVAAKEIGRSLGVAEVMVQLRNPQGNGNV